MTSLLRGIDADLDLCDIPGTQLKRLWLRLHRTPNEKTLDEIYNIIFPFMRNTEHSLLFHIQVYADKPTCKPPGIAIILNIVGHIMEINKTFEQTMRGTLLQIARPIDDAIIIAKGMFLSFYAPRRPFELLYGEDGSRDFIKRVVDKYNRKCHRRALKSSQSTDVE